MTTTGTRGVKSFSGLEALSQAAADTIVSIARESVGARGQFSIALSGGNTPKRTYQLLVEKYGDQIDWSRWQILFGDERFVPGDDPRSNYRMARETLLDAAAIPAAHVHPVATSALTVDDAADEYERTLRRVLTDGGATADLVLLGVGPDGHTASLFPGSPALDEQVRWVRGVDAPTTVQPAVPRVTVTLPFLNNAWNVLFLVAGADKRPVIEEIVDRTESAQRFPAAHVWSSGRNIWLVEESALPDRTKPNA